jgi:oligo-1,6-glucosidase
VGRLPNAGFTTGKPWIVVNPNYTSVNAEAQRGDPGSVFHYYRRLIRLRHTDPVVQFGDFTMLLPEHPYIYAFTRSLRETQLLILGNFCGDEQKAALGRHLDCETEVVIHNYPDPPPS